MVGKSRLKAVFNVFGAVMAMVAGSSQSAVVDPRLEDFKLYYRAKPTWSNSHKFKVRRKNKKKRADKKRLAATRRTYRLADGYHGLACYPRLVVKAVWNVWS